MAGILSKVETAINVATTVNNIYQKVNSMGLLNGINLSNIKSDNISSIGSTIKSNLENTSSNLMSELTKSIDTSQISNIASSITPQDVGIEVPDYNSIMNEAMSEIDTEGFDLSSIVNLEGISLM